MADNVPLPATGTGTANVVQATDDVAGIHYPRVKLIDGTADSTAVIPGSTANGLLTDVSRFKHTQGTPATATWTSASGTTTLPIAVDTYASLTASWGTDGGTISGATFVFEASQDGGATWYGVGGLDTSGTDAAYTAVQLRGQFITRRAVDSGVLGAGAYQTLIFSISGLTHFRVSLVDAITGTGSISLRLVPSTAAAQLAPVESDAEGFLHVVGATAEAATPAGGGASSQPVLVGGLAAGGTVRTLKTDISGELQVDVLTSPALTDTQLRATPVPVSGTVVTGALTDTQLRATPVPVSGTVTAVQSTAANLKVDASGVAVPITDNAGSLTVDNPALSVVGGGVQATAQRVTLASDSTGVVAVTDNAGSLTVDQPTGTNLHTVVDSGTITTVSTVTAVTTLGTITNVVHVDDNASSLTVDNPILSIVGGGTEAAAQRVTIANDSTGVLSVDDNGASLTVDGTVAVSTLPALVASSANIGDVDVLTVPAPLSTTGGGTQATALRVTVATDSSGVLAVTDNGGNLSIDDGGNVISVDDGAASLTVDAPVGTPVFVRLSDGAAAITALPITDNAGSLTVDQPTGTNLHTVLDSGTLTTVSTVTAVTSITNVVHVDDNAASLTVDNPTLSVVGGGTEATALRVTVANNSTGVLPVTDNGGSFTVDQPTGTNLHTVVDSGTLTAVTAITNVVHVDDNAGSLTIDAVTLPLPTGAATETTQLLQATELTLAKLPQAQGASSLTLSGPMMQAVVSDSPPSTYLDNYLQPLSLTTSGRLRVASEPSLAMTDFWQDPFEQELMEPAFYGGSSLSFYP